MIEKQYKCHFDFQEVSKWRKKREMHSKMMGAAINAGDMEAVKFHSTRIMQCDRTIAFLERNYNI